MLAVEPAGPQVAWPDEVRPPPEALAAPLESQLEQWTLQASLRRVQPLRGAQLAQAPEASLLVSLVLPGPVTFTVPTMAGPATVKEVPGTRDTGAPARTG